MAKTSRINIEDLDRLIGKDMCPNGILIRQVRNAFGLTQRTAAAMVGLSHGSRWAEFESDARPIDLARWELFLLKVGRHPAYKTLIKISEGEDAPVGLDVVHGLTVAESLRKPLKKSSEPVSA